MIFGITHTDKGEPIQRLSVSTKVAVGLAPDPQKGRKAPVKLDHFLFLKRTNNSKSLEAGWEVDPVLTEFYEKQSKSKTPREIDVILVDDELEQVFPSELAWWTATQKKCWGNGCEATRRTEANPKGEPWAPEQAPCGKECPDLQEARCKPSGDLRFMLADFPELGAISRIHTTSYKSVSQIHSALQQIQTITGGRLAGIRAKLVVAAEKTSYQGKDGQRHSTIVPILGLKIKSDGLQKMVDNMIEGAQVFQQTRKLLGGHVQVVEDEETTLAGELAPEFYHETTHEEKPENRSARRERERATLEPGKQPNRGHGKEMLAQDRVVPKTNPPAKSPAKPPAKPVIIEQTPQEASRFNDERYLEPEPEPEGDPMEQMCEVCEVPHARFFDHEGENGEGACMRCSCTQFSAIPPPPKLDTVFANAAKETSEPKWVEMRRVVGKMVEFQDVDSNGNMLKTSTGAQFVIVKLHDLPDDPTKDPHSKFYCYHKSLFDPLQVGLGEKVSIVYSVQPGNKTATSVYQMVHDVMQIGAQTFFEKKEECHGAGFRGTVRTVDPLNQETIFRAEDENQTAS